MSKEEAINILIKDGGVDTNKISDSYHTFGELYEHRITLFIKLLEKMKKYGSTERIWRSELHSDGSFYEGWFVLGVGEIAGEQITYHLPSSKWDECSFAETLGRAPEWDGHTSADVLERLKKL